MDVTLAYNVFPGVSGETVFFDSMKKFLVPSLREKGFSVRECPIPHSSWKPLSTLEFYSRFPLLYNARKMLAGSRDHDIVHFLNSSLVPAGSNLKKPRKAASAHLLGDAYLRLPPKEPAMTRLAGSAFSMYSNLLDRGPLRKLDSLAACTPFQAEDMIATHSLDPDRVSIIPPGIDTDYLRKLGARDLRSEYRCERVLAYVGRLHERSKGVSCAIRAMRHLDDGFKLLIVGDGPDRKAYERLVKDLGLGSRVVFLGVLGTEEKSAIQKSADAAVIPSFRDVFCTVFAESLACGVPVAAFDRPFWKGLYDGGAVFSEPNPEAFSYAVEKTLRRKTVERGLELAAQYDVRKTVASYVSLYEKLMGLPQAR